MNRSKIEKLLKYAEQFRKQAQVAYKRNPQTGEFEEISAEQGKQEWNKAQQQVAKQQMPSIPSETQKALNTLGYKGKDGKPLNPDGKLGPNSLFAVNQYIDKNKSRIPEGFAQPGDALYIMIQRDASGENKLTTFDHRAANDTLNAVQSLLTQFAATPPPPAASTIATLNQYNNALEQVSKTILDAYNDSRSTQQEKDNAKALYGKAVQLKGVMMQWFNRFNQKPSA